VIWSARSARFAHLRVGAERQLCTAEHCDVVERIRRRAGQRGVCLERADARVRLRANVSVKSSDVTKGDECGATDAYVIRVEQSVARSLDELGVVVVKRQSNDRARCFPLAPVRQAARSPLV
jgi:hypothetical protein